MQDPEHLLDVGKSAPMTIITVVKPLQSWLLKLVLFLVQTTGFGLGRVKRLRFIHFAQWTLIKPIHFRWITQDRSSNIIERNYFIFSTNYNGPWDQYIDSFSLVKGVRQGIGLLWGTSSQFPKAFPVRPFKRYIRYHEYPVDAYYNAYPDASIRDIESALAISELSRKLTMDFNLYSDLDAINLDVYTLQQLPGPRGNFKPHIDSKPAMEKSLKEFTDTIGRYLASTQRVRRPSRKDAAGPQGLQL